ncbi:MAG: polyprenol monophosphomannose synthase [bacterium]
MSTLRSLIIIPTYNEAENIEPLLNQIFSMKENFHILVIDDNSCDGTGKIVDKLSIENTRLHVIHRPSKQGLGSAYVCGFKYALERDFDLIFQMDADFSHDPQYLPQFLKAIEDNDVVIGSRYSEGISVVKWSLNRLLLSIAGCFYARFITRLKIRDITGGFKCFRRKVLETIDLNKIHSDGYAFQIEMNYKCVKKGFRVKEISIIFVDRRVGISKMSGYIIKEAIITPWKLILGF